MNNPLSKKGSSEANRWAQERQDKINKAKLLKEERKMGSIERNIDREIGYPPSEQQPNSNQRFQQQRPPSQEDISQARSSLRLLKSKKPSYKQEEVDEYDYDDRAYDSNKYAPPQAKTNAQAHLGGVRTGNGGGVNQNYRKVFNPNMTEDDPIDKKTAALQSDIRQLNKNLSSKEKVGLAGKLEINNKPPLYSKSEFEMPPSTKKSRLPALAEDNRTNNNRSRERSPITNTSSNGRRPSNGAIKVENNKIGTSNTGVVKRNTPMNSQQDEDNYQYSSTSHPVKKPALGGKPPVGGALGGYSNSVNYGNNNNKGLIPTGKNKNPSYDIDYDNQNDMGNFDDKPIGGARGNSNYGGAQKKAQGVGAFSGRDSPRNKARDQYERGKFCRSP
jgi:hypothetical protein